MSNKLTGKIRQLTIFGEIEFIDGYEYLANLDGDIITLSGEFKCLETDEIEPITITMSGKEYVNHLKK
jgi:hypothetical protein